MSEPSIGKLRWEVTLAKRVQSPDATTGIAESFADMRVVWAEITPVGLGVYIGSEQIESPITHRGVIRWTDDVAGFDVILRTMIRPTDGTTRRETFRIRRSADWQGRQRFTILDLELERTDG